MLLSIKPVGVFGVVRILLIHNHHTKFVQIDLELLRQRYDVQEWYQRSRVVNLPAQLRAIVQSDLIFGWFASWHTFLPFLFAHAMRKRSLLVVGGYDTANLPEINYGSQRGGFKKWIAQTTMRLATRIIAFSEYSRCEVIENANIASNKVETIYLGVPPHDLVPRAKEELVLTVGNVDHDNLFRKGLEPFVRAAHLIPECEFVMIGAWRDHAIRQLRAFASPNVRFTDWINEDALNEYFSRAAVYVQASRHEGFGLAVAEAMLHHCVPVVTRAGSLPEVVGEAGVYLDSAEPSAIAEGIRRALAMKEALGTRARERILTRFPLGKRAELLFRTIDVMLRYGG